MSAAELELVVQCKLEQSEVARQKHHAPMAARIVLATLKLLQSSNLFKKKKLVPHPPRYDDYKSMFSKLKNTLIVSVQML